jgi:hypothetical protein
MSLPKQRPISTEDVPRPAVAHRRRDSDGPLDGSDQAWFWTPEWQKREQEADASFAAGRSAIFLTAEEFLADLDE